MGIAERKEREFRRREQQILRAALKLFEGEDWQQVTIERIAQAAEIGKGTVYLHFPSKEDIYGRLALDFARKLLQQLRAIDTTLPVVARMREATHAFFTAHLAGGRYQRVVEYCSAEDCRKRLRDETRQELEGLDGEIIGLIHAVLRQGVEEGVFPDRPLDVLCYGPHSTMVGAVRLLRGGECLGPVDSEVFIAELTRFVLAGLMFQDRVPGIDQPAATSREPAANPQPTAS
jgi:AcrR family transcriptional regulator